MRLGTNTGSMCNYLMSGTKGAPEPKVGMGATCLEWTDRHAATIVAIERFKSGAKAGQVKAVLATRDIATRTDKNGMSEDQSYSFATDSAAHPDRYVLNKRGAFKCSSTQLRIGERGAYHDFSF